MSDWSQELAARFRGIEDRRQTKDQIKLRDAALLTSDGPILWETLTHFLNEKCGELNAEPDMRGVKVTIETDIPNAVTIRRDDTAYSIKGVYDPQRNTINFTPTEEGAFRLMVLQGASQVSIVNPRGSPATVDEIAESVIRGFLTGE